MSTPTLTSPDPAPAAPQRPSLVRRIASWIRNSWRTLTSMRTALVLLFMLAVASIPGAVLPQRDINQFNVNQFIERNGLMAELLDRLQMFDVFKSVWFTAIYVLLFVSLTGCIIPRVFEHYRALRTPPVSTPRNLKRMPRHAVRESNQDPATVAAAITTNLRGWRKISRPADPTDRRPDSDGTITISAEKGYLREVGNLIFHISLLGMLLAIAIGHQFGYEGSRIVIQGDSGFCNSPSSYDTFRAGPLVDGTGLTPFCLRTDQIQADYLPSGQADMFSTEAIYQDGAAIAANTSTEHRIEVNKPLRTDGVRIYMLGHGYAATFTVTYPNGETRTQTMQFAPQDMITFLSSGALRFDPPASTYTTDEERRSKQIGIQGLLAPTKQLDGTLLTSSFPTPRDPAVAVDIYVGDTGLDTGRPQNIFSLSQTQIDSGRLVQQARVNLDMGQSTTLADGTQVRFDGVTNFAALQVSHDPAQLWILTFTIGMLGGLVVSLVIRRRRVFARLTPRDDGGTVIEFAGLARTDEAGWNEDFDALADRLINDDKVRTKPGAPTDGKKVT